jgi:tetratricopeptide (TPR) repeat protein
LSVLCLSFTGSAVAQVIGGHPGNPDSDSSRAPTYETTGSVLLLTVTRSPKGRLDRQAVVKLLNRRTGVTVWQTTNDRGGVSFGDLEVALYDVEVSAVGYLTAHKEINVMGLLITYQQEIALEPDPASIELAASHASQLPKKARKAISRGVTALKSSNYKEAEKQLHTAVSMAPDSGDANFLSGYLAFQQKRFDMAKDYLRRALSLDPQNVQAARLLGRMGLQQGDYNAAKAALEQAVAIDTQEWMPHYQLAETYLKLGEFGKARDQAEAAIACNQVASTPAQLVLGEALSNLGRTEEAIQAFHTFLQNDPGSPLAAQVRDFIPRLSRRAVEPDGGQGAPAAGPIAAPDLQLADAEPHLAVMDWQPPGVDDSKPVVAAGVACPTEMVINLAGQRVKQLADDVARFAAIEDLVHERLDAVGYPLTRETRKFNYVVSITDTPPNGLELSEYRSEHSGPPEFPDKIASSGFISLALVFHPAMRDEFQMTCEGLGDWHGQTTWLIYFRQRTDRPNRLHSYVLNGKAYPVGLKGRAWIKTDTFQIVRMESDLVSPAPAIQLTSEHQIVEYGPIMFAKKNEELWLPQSAQLYFEFRKRRYFRRHSFDHFMLFSVDSAEKRNEPKEPSQNPVPVPN